MGDINLSGSVALFGLLRLFKSILVRTSSIEGSYHTLDVGKYLRIFIKNSV